MKKIAIIMPLYNAERYVSEAIESVINQTIGFKEFVELIIINDGSQDRSKEICEYYQSQYPDNITFVCTENQGPSAARNYAYNFLSNEIEYIGFLDADDRLALNALEKVYLFFTNHQVDMAVIPVMYFNSEGEFSEHRLNYRFHSGTRVINILKEYNASHFYAGGLFVSRKIIDENRFQFDTSMFYWEDTLSINQYLIKYNEYGVVANTFYYYRRQINNHSIVDYSWNKKERYNFLLENGYLRLINMSLDIHGKVIPYIQFLIVYHLKLYLFKKNSCKMMSLLSDSEKDIFYENIVKILQFIDEQYILEQRMKHYFKEFLISVKRNGWPLKYESIVGSKFIKEPVIIKKKFFMLIGLKIIGYYRSEYYNLTEDDFISIKYKNKFIKCKRKNINKKIDIWGKNVKDYRYAGFEVFIPIHRLKFCFYLNKNNKQFELNFLNYYERFILKFGGKKNIENTKARTTSLDM